MSDERWDGGAVGERAVCVREDNPGVMTLDGTNTWVLREPGGERSVVVDPGELDEPHLRAVLEVAAPVALVLLTHRHGDHTGGAAWFADAAGCPVRATDPDHCTGAPPLADGEEIEVDGLRLRVVATPGHTSDSTSFLLTDASLLTGDTVLGRGTTVVAHPDGALGPYLDSLERLSGMVDAGEVARLLPGHGPVVDDAGAVLDFYLTHRAQRLEQVRAAVADGAVTPRAVVERVYADVDESVWPAAELSVAAQLDHLAAGG
ncbi:MAG: MBL fold metallo-hydrolase [Nocardioidaceae bacterium]|nr:MBL fold metallo-hydrolase [Nocardioidaceae bacterium]